MWKVDGACELVLARAVSDMLVRCDGKADVCIATTKLSEFVEVGE